MRELVEGQPTLTAIVEALLVARAVLARELAGLEKRRRGLARLDTRTRLLMSTPGVGVIVALTFVAAIDDPEPVQIVPCGRRALRVNAEEVSVGRD